MGTIINNLSNFYYDFHEGGEFSKEKAEIFFNSYNNKDRHIKYIKEIYETILSSSIINETSKIIIKTRKTYAETARYYNSLHQQEIENTVDSSNLHKPRRPKTPELVKADIYYTNRKLENILSNYKHTAEYPQKDFFTLIIYQSNISDTLWNEANESLERLKVTLNGKLISKGAFWLNIPVREYNKELTDEEFTHLLELITPYFNTQKVIAQQRLNGMSREVGYLNYILKSSITLNEIDETRRNIILSLSSKEQVEKFKRDQQHSQSNPLYQYETQLTQLREEIEKEKQARINIMSKVGQIYYQTSGRLSEKHQLAVDNLGKEYDQLKKISQSKQQRIEQLHIKIKEIKGE